MKKFIIIFFFTVSFYAQKDIRSVNWGSTIDEVELSEKPFNPSTKNDELLIYENVNIGNDIFAKITYFFTRGKLSQVFYNVYSNSGNCNFMPSLSSRYLDNKFIFDILASKGYDWDPSLNDWYFGGHVYDNIDKSILLKYFRNNYEGEMKLKPEYNIRNFNHETLNTIDLIGEKIFSTYVTVRMLNSRTDLRITFPTILNKKEDYCSERWKWMEEKKYFKKIIELEFAPDDEVKKQIFKSNF